MKNSDRINTYLMLVGIVLLGSNISCTKEVALPVTADFSISIIDESVSVPVRVIIKNLTKGADEYQWIFEGGEPSSSSQSTPSSILYNTPGTYTLKLVASNIDGSIDSVSTEIVLFSSLNVGFIAEVIGSNFPTVEVALINATKGGVAFKWLFEGGNPASSEAATPDPVFFETPGKHAISLTVNNGLDTTTVADTITVAPYLVSDFTYSVSMDDDDYQVPLTLMTSNASVSATSYRWTVAGGSPIVSDDPSPTFTFTQPGEQTLILRAENDKNTHSVSKTITLYANTNLRTFSNVKFGINTAHNTDSIGAFFSTSTRKVYAKEALNEETAPLIDMVYFGLNKDFTFNRFVSPSSLAGLTFEPLPNAIHTTFINLQESCECSAALSVSAFDALSDDTDLRTMTIEETTAGIQDFDNTVSPRIVLFETADGRKGAIKIKGFISDGNYSYILTDIKVQKEAM